jgi:hypothetical protein
VSLDIRNCCRHFIIYNQNEKRDRNFFCLYIWHTNQVVIFYTFVKINASNEYRKIKYYIDALLGIYSLSLSF